MKATPQKDTRDAFLGSLLGLAVGDAMGAGIESMPPGTFEPVTAYIGSDYHDLRPGEWTDDTALALCTAESLLHSKGWDPHDHMRRLTAWREQGHLSCSGKAAGIGGTISGAIDQYLKDPDNPYTQNPHTVGNGVIMRLGPVALYYYPSLEDTIKYSELLSRTTHPTPVCIESAILLGALIHQALKTTEKDIIAQVAAHDQIQKRITHPELRAILNHTYPESQVTGKGHAITTLIAAIHCFQTTNTFQEGLLKAVNLGWDADTTAAVYGQVAGAYYGCSAIPKEWLDTLAKAHQIQDFAERLYAEHAATPAH